MFGMKFYSKEDSKENNSSDENNTDLFIISGENTLTRTSSADEENVQAKQEYFNKWKDSINFNNELGEGENCQYGASCNQINCNQYNYNDDNFVNNEEGDDERDDDERNDDDDNEKINKEDDEEDSLDKLYVISMDSVPYYYENDLVSARTKMWAIANNLLRKNSDNEFENCSNYIFTNDLNKVSLISPYNFFGLNYHHTICELQIDYVIRYTK
jgi:hypothetical protein